MSFIVVAVAIGLGLLATLLHAGRGSPFRMATSTGGLLIVLLAIVAAPAKPETPTEGPIEPRDIGEATFKQFYDVYAAYLGSPVSKVADYDRTFPGDYDRTFAEWFRFARVDALNDPKDPRALQRYGGARHPSFPKLVLAPLGEETRRNDRVEPVSDAKPPEIVSRYLEGRKRSDFVSVAASRLSVQNFGDDAKFKDFYDVYRSVLGEPVSNADTRWPMSQWFTYGRVELHLDYDKPLHPKFPKLELGLVGDEYMRKKQVAPDDKPAVPAILAAWVASRINYEDVLYLYGLPLTNPKPDKASGFTTQYFQRAVFQWPNEATEPTSIVRLPVGLELLNSEGTPEVEQAKADFIAYFYGQPVTDENQRAGVSTMYYERAVFQWPAGSKDPTEVRLRPIGAELFGALNTMETPSPWSSASKVVLLTLGGLALLASLGLAFVLGDVGRVYGRR